MNLKAEKKVINHKRSTLELSEALGNISEACKRKGISRAQFYEWACCFQTHGMEGLKDLPPTRKNHPFTTPKEVVEKIKKLSLAHPCKGCK